MNSTAKTKSVIETRTSFMQAAKRFIQKASRDGIRPTLRIALEQKQMIRSEGKIQICKYNSFSKHVSPAPRTNQSTVHIIAVAFENFGPLKVFVQSIINQTAKNWRLTVIHDGHNQEFLEIGKRFIAENGDQIEFYCTDVRYNDYGHTLRDLGLKNIQGDYVLLTNGDNYLIPKAIEFITPALNATNADILIFDMVHSHAIPGGRLLPSYSFFETRLERGSIDMGAAIVKRELAEKVGFRDKGHSGDASYFEDIIALQKPENLLVAKVPRVLFVHN